MRQLFHRSRKKGALPPGTLEYFGEKKIDDIQITVLDYDESHLDENKIGSIQECFPLRDSPSVSWINLYGLHDTQLIHDIGGHFGLHPLVMEDIVNTHQRPKMEDYQDYIYLVIRMLHYDDEQHVINSEQISLILGPNYVLSFQETVGDVFDPVRERLRKGKGRSRKMGADYLAYALIDAVVDHCFLILEKFGEQIELLEEELTEEPKPDQLNRIHHLKRESILLRKSIWPLREVVNGLTRTESKLIKKGTAVFLRDVYDHTIQVVDAVESFRDILSGLQDLYLSSISNKMNEVMKVLTIIATIFIPLSFLAGLYGMNFEFMPELGWKWAYPIFLVVIVSIGGGMLSAFRRKGWL